MRLLFVTDLWPTERHPGAGRWIVEAVEQLAEDGASVHVVVLRRVFPPHRFFSALASPRRAWREFLRWRADVRAPLLSPRFTTEIQYTSPPRRMAHYIWGDYAWVMRRSALVGVARRFKPDIVAGHFAIPSGDVATRIARIIGVKAAVFVHGADLAFTAALSSRSRKRVTSVLSSCDLVVANSGRTMSMVNALCTPRRMIVLWQGGDVIDTSRRNWPSIQVLSVGNLWADKGWMNALLIVGGLHASGLDVTWTIVGQGAQTDIRSLMDACASAGLESVVSYVGELPGAEVNDLMGSSDIFLLPSQIDAYGVVFAEALGAGLLVAGGACSGAIQDFIAAGAPVISVGPNSNDEAIRVIHSCAVDYDRLAQAQLASRLWAERNLGWARYADALVTEFMHVCMDSREWR